MLMSYSSPGKKCEKQLLRSESYSSFKNPSGLTQSNWAAFELGTRTGYI